MRPRTGTSLRIAFLHPDLGIGGAERLVVDAARSLQAAGHQVTIFTSHHDVKRCFEATRDGSLEVRVYGDFLPSHVGQHLRAPCAIARMTYLACLVATRRYRFDIIFCDLVAQAILPLKLLGRARIVFYCHFPDQLLVPHDRWLYRIYRWPIDCSEELSTGLADRVLVNSRYTAAAFRRAFPRLGSLTPEVLHPGVACTPDTQETKASVHDRTDEREVMILSINRYEAKKNVGLAVESLAQLRHELSYERFERIQLTIAGGYDSRLRENWETLAELQQLARRLELEKQIVFLQSCTDAERLALLARCLFVVYTPANEHFGYTPLEAMAAGRPVVAVNNGGPTETVRNGETGLLCAATPAAFARAFKQLLDDRGAARRMGWAGREHVARNFSTAAFGRRLEEMMFNLAKGDPKQ